MRYFLLTVALLCCLGCDPAQQDGTVWLGDKYEVKLYAPSGRLMSRIQFYSTMTPVERYTDGWGRLYSDSGVVKQAPAGWYFDVSLMDDGLQRPEQE